MATVTGKTSEKIDELLDSGIVSAELNADGQLTLATRGGSTINAGSVSNTIVSGVINTLGRLILTRRNGTTIDAGPAGGKPIDAWPVGSIFMTANQTNPNTLLGGGTWVVWGQGRVPVSVSPTEGEFDAVEETGGEKYSYLNASHLPPHAHGIAHAHSMAHNHSIDHAHSSRSAAAGGSTLAFARSTNTSVVSGGGMVEAFDGVSGAASAGATGGTNVSTSDNGPGSSAYLSNMQPYITCYMWKRTA